MIKSVNGIASVLFLLLNPSPDIGKFNLQFPIKYSYRHIGLNHRFFITVKLRIHRRDKRAAEAAAFHNEIGNLAIHFPARTLLLSVFYPFYLSCFLLADAFNISYTAANNTPATGNSNPPLLHSPV